MLLRPSFIAVNYKRFQMLFVIACQRALASHLSDKQHGSIGVCLEVLVEL